MKEVIIRKGTSSDLAQIAKIEQLCFATPWSYESLEKDLCENQLASYVVAEVEGEVAGYVGIWSILDEGHINNVAVAPPYRRAHIGERLLLWMFEEARTRGIDIFTLEVRAGNKGAIRLYEKLGFETLGIRHGYYEDNGEDALIMWKK